MTNAALRERVERFVALTPRDAVNHLLVAFFMNAIREQKGGPLSPLVKDRRKGRTQPGRQGHDD